METFGFNADGTRRIVQAVRKVEGMHPASNQRPRTEGRKPRISVAPAEWIRLTGADAPAGLFAGIIQELDLSNPLVPALSDLSDGACWMFNPTRGPIGTYAFGRAFDDVPPEDYASDADVDAGGGSYTVGDVLTVVGGTGQATKLMVDTVSAGAVTAVTITRPGTYQTNPSNPVSVTGGTGSGATFTLTFKTWDILPIFVAEDFADGPTGSGITNYVARWLDAHTLGTGTATDDGAVFSLLSELSLSGGTAALRSGDISNATNATPIVITSTAHGLTDQEMVFIQGVTGNTAANGSFRITRIDADHFSINSVGSGSYGSGGIWWEATLAVDAITMTVEAGGGGHSAPNAPSIGGWPVLEILPRTPLGLWIELIAGMDLVFTSHSSLANSDILIGGGPSTVQLTSGHKATVHLDTVIAGNNYWTLFVPVTTINGKPGSNQVFSVSLGTSGTDLGFTLTDSNAPPGTHAIALNVPDASATARGVVTHATQVIGGTKNFHDGIGSTSSSTPWSALAYLTTPGWALGASAANEPTFVASSGTGTASLDTNALVGLVFVALDPASAVSYAQLSGSLTSNVATSSYANNFHFDLLGGSGTHFRIVNGNTATTYSGQTGALQIGATATGGIITDLGSGGTGSPLTTKGDIFVYSSTNTRLPVGSNGQFLTADSTQTTGLKWVTTLPIANGGTNSTTALNNNRVMVSSSGAIVEAGAMTNGQLLIGSTSAAPVVAALTAGTGITVTNGAGSITIAATSTAVSFNQQFKNSDYTLATTDKGTSIIFYSGAHTLTLFTSTTTDTHFYCWVYGRENTVTLTPGGGESVNGNTSGVSLVLPACCWAMLTTDANGTWFAAASISYSTAQKALTSAAPTDGQILIGSSAHGEFNLATITAGSGITVTNGNGSITIAASGGGTYYQTVGYVSGSAMTQRARLDFDPDLFTLTDNSGGNATSVTLTSNVVTLAATPTDGQLLIGSTSAGNLGLATLTAGSGISVTNGSHSVTVAISAPVSIANGGTNSTTALSNKRIMVSSSGAIVEAGAMTNGQLLIGSTSNAPVVAALTAGTGISVTNGAGSITIAISTPVSIANGGTNSTTALNNNRIMVSSSGAIVEAGAMTNGQLLIGSTSAAPGVATLTAGTGISITNAAASITVAVDTTLVPASTQFGRVTSDVTTTSGSSYSDVTGLSFSVNANEIWTFEFNLALAGPAAGTLLQFSGPSSPTDVMITAMGNTNQLNAISTEWQTSFTAFSTGWCGGSINGVVRFTGCFANGSNSGTVKIQLKSVTNGQTSNVKKDSWMRATKIG